LTVRAIVPILFTRLRIDDSRLCGDGDALS
jgi:hypothetical protein